MLVHPLLVSQISREIHFKMAAMCLLMSQHYIKRKNQEEVGHQVPWDSLPSHMLARCSVPSPRVTASRIGNTLKRLNKKLFSRFVIQQLGFTISEMRQVDYEGGDREQQAIACMPVCLKS